MLRDPLSGPLWVAMLGLLCGVVGFRLGWRSGSRIAMPLLQGGMGFLAFLYGWVFLGPVSGVVGVAGWVLGTTVLGLAAFVHDPGAADARVLRAGPYREEMLTWLRTGAGPEARPGRTALAHLRELAVYLAAAAATANAAGLVMGAILLNYMNAYVARLLGAARRPWTVALLAWNVWSVVRVAGYVALGAACAAPVLRLAGKPGEPREVRALAIGGAAAVVLDLALKLLLSRPAGRALGAAVDLERAGAPVEPRGACPGIRLPRPPR